MNEKFKTTKKRNSSWIWQKIFVLLIGLFYWLSIPCFAVYPGGIFESQLSFSVELIKSHFALMSNADLQLYQLGQVFDSFFAIANGGLIYCCASLTLCALPIKSKLFRVGRLSCILGIVCGISDNLENLFILLMCKNPANFNPILAVLQSISAVIKFSSMIIAWISITIGYFKKRYMRAKILSKNIVEHQENTINKTKDFQLVFFFTPLISVIICVYSFDYSFLTSTEILARCLALVSFFWLSENFLLIARPKFLDKIIALPRSLAFHCSISFGIIVFDVISLILTPTIMGVCAASFFVVIIAGAVRSLTKKEKSSNSKFQQALKIHNLMLVAAFLFYLNSLIDIATLGNSLYVIILSCYMFFAFSLWVYHKVGRLYILKKTPYQIEKIVQENDNITTFILKPQTGEKVAFKPGQYAYFLILDTHISREFHPFSFSSSPNVEESLSVTIKKLGDYTQQINSVAIGSLVLIDGPYGKFSPELSANWQLGLIDELIFIAGGIGIAPFLSILEYLRTSNPKVKLSVIYGVRTERDLIKMEYLTSLKSVFPKFALIPVISDDEHWIGESGFIDQVKLEHYVPCDANRSNFQKKEYYICGPLAMNRKVLQSLRKMGVSKDHIFIENMI